ncbi:hypothetical protein KIN20_035470 [Parelaphostrongylus tenuis]|uniref:Uncharacterized protein n=1 Tax=Parelaphostrongylus tenuis TaxID=148309 RepID=A0AAD5RB82_PARTN|nr:hypothetical protein KIN20_035470 [Parelaphostrongylus tenuis]
MPEDQALSVHDVQSELELPSDSKHALSSNELESIQVIGPWHVEFDHDITI